MATGAGCGRHHNSAAMTARNETALIRNGQATPNAMMMAPAMAGPMARLMFMPTACSATAGCRCSRSTSFGMIDCHVGDMMAVPTPSAKVAASSVCVPA